MPFQINGTDPPEGGHPRGDGYWLRIPEATGTDGLDRPCGAVGKPYIEIEFERCSQTVWNWYAAFTDGALYATLTSVQAWEDHKTGGAGWTTWSGSGITILRPTCANMKMGQYFGVRITIKNLS